MVVPALREAIVEGVLAPGSRLSEVQVAKQLNVSRTPMREAFAQLEREGLVTVLPRVGAYVRAVTLRDVEEIYTVRAALECLAVQLASESGNEATMKQLQAVVDVDDPATGTVRLRRAVDDADEMALDTRSTKTVRVGPATT